MLARTAHFSFTVDNLDRSVAFYRDTLGMEVVRTQVRQGEDISTIVAFGNAHLRIAFLALPPAGDVQLELIEYVAPRADRASVATNMPGSAHIAFYVDDMEITYLALKEKGVRFKSEPVEAKSGVNKGGWVAYFLDIEGNTLELIQPPKR